MAREVITKIWCDVCLQDDVYTDGSETPPITIGSLKPRVMALCDVHVKEVFDPIKELLTELGQVLPQQGTMARMPGTSPGSGVWPCPDPQCAKHTRPYKHEQSLRNHVRQEHQMALTEWNEKFGIVEEGALFADAPKADDGPAVTTVKCDQPGCDVSYSYPDYKRPAQAMGVHRAKAHGIRGAKHDTKKKPAAK